MTEVVRVGNVELLPTEAYELYESGKYIVTYKTIYQLHYSNAQKRVYGSKIYNATGNMTLRGRWFALDAECINNLLGFKLLIESK